MEVPGEEEGVGVPVGLVRAGADVLLRISKKISILFEFKMGNVPRVRVRI